MTGLIYNKLNFWLIVISLVFFAIQVFGAGEKTLRNDTKQVQGTFVTDVPVHKYDIVLARPTENSVTASILAYQNMDGYLVYGTARGLYNQQTALRIFVKDTPAEIIVDKLRGDTQYYYQFRWRLSADAPYTASDEYSFHTQRAAGKTFSFTIIADSHLDERTTTDLYLQTLRNSLADRPDFNIDLGDTFMTEKHINRESAAKQYLAQRYYFGQLCHSVPLFLTIGNHDGETSRENDGTADSLAVWSNFMRKKYFPNPVPDNFYSGNAIKNSFAGILQNYYSFAWGDARFIVLDPYWPTPRQRGSDDNWTRTLGNTQYQWLKETLEKSREKYKFVFIHHLVGGIGKDARGGAEAVPYYEWGGKNSDGTDGFTVRRPGWTMPIHQLLVKNHVTAVYHGHDHLFAKQEVDGVIYQEAPQPGWQGRYDPRRAVEYGYEKGVILGSSGHLRVTVSEKDVKTTYIRALLSKDEINGQKNGMTANEYDILP